MSTASIVLMSILITMEALSFVKLFFMGRNKKRAIQRNREILVEMKREFTDYLGTKESCKLDEMNQTLGKILERLDALENKKQ